MPRKKHDSPYHRIAAESMSPLLIEQALTGPGMAHQCSQLFDGSMPMLCVVAVGPSAPKLLEIVEAYYQQVAAQVGAPAQPSEGENHASASDE